MTSRRSFLAKSFAALIGLAAVPLAKVAAIVPRPKTPVHAVNVGKVFGPQDTGAIVRQASLGPIAFRQCLVHGISKPIVLQPGSVVTDTQFTDCDGLILTDHCTVVGNIMTGNRRPLLSF